MVIFATVKFHFSNIFQTSILWKIIFLNNDLKFNGFLANLHANAF